MIESPRVLNFFELNDGEYKHLHSRVYSSMGLIRAFVHPFYEEYIQSQCWKSRDRKKRWPRIEAASVGLTRILSLPPDRTPPVFVFEEEANEVTTTSRLAEMNQTSGNEAYIIPTHWDTSTPRFSNDVDYDFSRNDNWRRLSKFFRKLGVTQIIPSGNRFIVEPGYNHRNGQGKWYNTYRCVGTLINELSPTFQIVLSAMTHPHSRLDVHNIDASYIGANVKLKIGPRQSN